MRILFLFILLFSWVSTSLYADSEIGLEEKQAQNECLYKGQEVTIQNVLQEEVFCLSNAVKLAAQEYGALSEDFDKNLPEGSLLRNKLQKAGVSIQTASDIPVVLNITFYKNIGDIYNHFAPQICLCDQCKALIEQNFSLVLQRNELYATLQKITSDDYVSQSPFFIQEVRDCLPAKSSWKKHIDKAIHHENSSNQEFYDPFEYDLDPFSNGRK